MTQTVYLTRTTSYFPNQPVYNDEMEDFIGKIGGVPSRVRPIILRQNGIKTRYYVAKTEHSHPLERFNPFTIEP